MNGSLHISAECGFCGLTYDPLPDTVKIYASEMLRGDCCGREDCAADMYESLGLSGTSALASHQAPTGGAYQRRQPTRISRAERHQEMIDRRQFVKQHQTKDANTLASALGVSKATILSDLRALGLSKASKYNHTKGNQK